jgi:PiT family inorganic phosphate transporter
MQHPRLRPIGAILVLTAGVMVGPALLGVGVAETLSHKLVTFQTVASQNAFAIGLCASLLVVTALTTWGVPTSLSLALVGGITGAGVGLGLPVAWSGIGKVLVFAAVAPLLGGLAAAGLMGLSRVVPMHVGTPRAVRWASLGGYLGQALAYGANGGEKVLAVFAVSGTAGGISAGGRFGSMALIGFLFAAGAVLSVRRLAGRLGGDLLAVRPVHQISAEFASSAAVMVSMAAGMPASMSESVASALVGAGLSESRRRVRWKAVGRLGLAWLVTLPASTIVAFLAVASLGSVG